MTQWLRLCLKAGVTATVRYGAVSLGANVNSLSLVYTSRMEMMIGEEIDCSLLHYMVSLHLSIKTYISD